MEPIEITVPVREKNWLTDQEARVQNKLKDNRYVQYGSGWCAPSGWRNFDASPTLRFERIPFFGRLYTKNGERFPENVEYGDIVSGLPLPENSCQAIYCSHILEHLALDDFRTALGNTYKALAPGGIFRFVLPDLEYFINAYRDDPSYDAAIRFMSGTRLGREQRSRGLKGMAMEWLGNSQHYWMWDYKSIKCELLPMGFTDVRRADFGDSSLTAFQAVEDPQRWENCLGVECRK
jgi:predicted SAM-dependent methyltransferase